MELPPRHRPLEAKLGELTRLRETDADALVERYEAELDLIEWTEDGQGSCSHRTSRCCTDPRR